MAQPYDVTTKQLVERQPLAWLSFLGLPGDAVEIIDADLSLAPSEADKVIRVLSPAAYLLHLEFQSGYEARMGKREARYSLLLDAQHDLPVQSVVILLRPEADGPGMSGSYQRRLPGQPDYLTFHYAVVRIWERPAAELLEGGLGTLPLAPLANVTAAELPAVLQRMQERFHAEASPGDERDLWMAAYLLMGLRYSAPMIEQLLKGVSAMRESSTYQAILAEGEARGRVEGERDLLLKMGRKRFGEPDSQTLAALEAITSVERIERFAERLLEVESWQELLA